MNEYPVKILECSYINHDVKRFIVEKPEGYTFIPGQATVVSIDLPEWKNELRPFTFTSLNEWPYLEFTIKIYNDHHGVTEQLGKTNAGATLLMHNIFGTIQYRGPAYLSLPAQELRLLSPSCGICIIVKLLPATN